MSIFTTIKEKIASLKDRSAVARVVINKYFIAVLVFVLLLLFNTRTSVFQMFRSLSTLHSQKKQEQYYRQAIQTTDERINQLTSNKDTLEMFARENYYFLEDGEDVFIVEKAKD